MSIIGFPLLLIPIAICNIVIFMMPGVGFDAALTRVPLPSGAVWTISGGDMLVAFGVLLLLFEVIKAGRPGAKYLTDHLLSLLVLAGTVAEFVLLPQFANPTVFLLATLMLVDFFAGIALRRRPQPRVAHQAAEVEPETAPTEPATAPAASPEASAKSTSSVASASAAATASSASSSAASIAEAVLLDRPQPVAAPTGSPRVTSPALQPDGDAAGAQAER
ncbi:hypothetical protein LPW26_14000 [Rhodopseudomonas sp. HC1]|uniref:hypothetical protein n=1 Tax=Rhodopseudomonas infernalis TaxID=2897386 RepID=UPI001EE7E794|nr:hypothetical protein [Rhodopseudomonas infernalis]MCG6205761.1 hypothetical protein [Rhodopseudomonas infernalis]